MAVFCFSLSVSISCPTSAFRIHRLRKLRILEDGSSKVRINNMGRPPRFFGDDRRPTPHTIPLDSDRPTRAYSAQSPSSTHPHKTNRRRPVDVARCRPACGASSSSSSSGVRASSASDHRLRPTPQRLVSTDRSTPTPTPARRSSMDPKRSAGAVGGGSGLKVANILDRPIAKRTGTSEVGGARCMLSAWSACMGMHASIDRFTLTPTGSPRYLSGEPERLQFPLLRDGAVLPEPRPLHRRPRAQVRLLARSAIFVYTPFTSHLPWRTRLVCIFPLIHLSISI